jgi:hypothetical protein
LSVKYASAALNVVACAVFVTDTVCVCELPLTIKLFVITTLFVGTITLPEPFAENTKLVFVAIV